MPWKLLLHGYSHLMRMYKKKERSLITVILFNKISFCINIRVSEPSKKEKGEKKKKTVRGKGNSKKEERKKKKLWRKRKKKPDCLALFLLYQIKRQITFCLAKRFTRKPVGLMLTKIGWTFQLQNNINNHILKKQLFLCYIFIFFLAINSTLLSIFFFSWQSLKGN